MFTFFPIISLILLTLIFWKPNQDWRSAILSAAIVWGVLVTVFTEGLSLFRLITFNSVLTLWLLTSLVLGLIYYKLLKQGKRSLKLTTVFPITPVSLLLLAGIIFIVATVGLIAIVAPPNNWDSMTYHMPRVVHWIQNHTVAHYPTYYSPQLVHPPGAEFVIMHLQILSGGDRFANLVQWLSMIGSILGVSLIAKQLGSNRQGQIFSAVFCVTIPMGILQGSSTQNDYAVCFWLVCLAHYIIATFPYQNIPLNLTLSIGASLGLALFTKTSGYIFAFPFMVWFFLAKVKQMRWKLWRPIGIVAMVILSLNLNHYLRNLELFGNLLSGNDFEGDYKPGIYSLPTFLSNIIRNLSFHVDIVRHLGLQHWITPTTGIVQKLVIIIHNILGIDANDPRITHPLNSYRVPGLSFNEDVAVNPLHFFLILIAILLFICYKKLRKSPEISGYFLSIIGSFLVFSLLLKIQPYHPRHHLSLFVLLSAFVGVVFSQAMNRYLMTAIAIILLATAMPFLFNNQVRPIAAEKNIFNTSRNESYFITRKYLTAPYLDAANFLKDHQCDNIGLYLGISAWEYPFWSIIKPDNNPKIRIEHILNPQNPSYAKTKVYPYNQFNPCAIIVIRNHGEKLIEKMVIETGTYVQKWEKFPVYILQKESDNL